MARRTLPLTATGISSAKSRLKQYTIFDGDGLFMVIMPAKIITDKEAGREKILQGSKLWRFKYRFEGKEKLLSFGSFPEVTLTDAREKRDTARKQVVAGIDPSAVRKATKETKTSKFRENSFEVIAREWHSKHKHMWSEGHAEIKLNRLVDEVFPYIGEKPIKSIIAPELLCILRRVEGRGALDTAHRVHTDIRKVFVYAIGTCRAERNPAADINGSLPPVKNNNHAALTEPKPVGQLLRSIDAYTGSHIVRAALKLAPMLFVRPGELRHAEWEEIDFVEKQWNIPGAKMKMKKPHIVPLARQAIEILKDLQPLSGSGKWVFPSARGYGRCMSENTLNAALQTLGYTGNDHVAHGFRATARTRIREKFKNLVDVEWIEIQLAHKTKAPNGTAYDRVAFIDERREMMQLWADYMDQLRQL